eukprot:comp22854_c1_seq1/m.36043 comp22854_c1_seq1/g.36043  ORF comp22854_c1_seq1/g.36043 comp22854_c1_seq1/m.36043 type:complete len:236 (-) comp22854_c1_seq1:69-776(-)
MNRGSIPPNHTVYVKNVNEKIKKQELRRSLYALFSQYGPVLDVVALKTTKCRGQAWVAFKDVSAASKAIFGLQGFVFYDRPLKLFFSLNKSDSVARMDGTFGKNEKAPAPPAVSAPAAAPKAEKRKAEEEGEQPAKKAATEKAAPAPGTQRKPEDNPPHTILLLINLPEETTELMLQALFSQFPGLKEVRLIPNRTDVAFVEYETIEQASNAREGLQGFLIKPQQPMTILFAKKG